MLKKVKQRNEGFTIIEVMIVLAIAGLIMLVVFLAVPALQRNARNTQRKNDVAQLLGAASEYVSNNAGSIAFANTDITGNVKPGYYSGTYLTVSALPSPVPAPSVDAVVIYTKAKCGTTPTADPITGTTRQYVAFYAVESASGTVKQCQDG